MDPLTQRSPRRQSMSSLSGPLQVVPDIDDQVANPENPQEVGAGGLPLVLGLRFCGDAFFGLVVLGELPWAASPAGPAALSTCMPQAAFPRPFATFPPRIPIPRGLQPAELHGSELSSSGACLCAAGSWLRLPAVLCILLSCCCLSCWEQWLVTSPARYPQLVILPWLRPVGGSGRGCSWPWL